MPVSTDSLASLTECDGSVAQPGGHGECAIKSFVPKKFKPVEEYLKEQGRFSHLFKPVRQEEIINKIQETVNTYWKGIKE